MPEPFKPVAHNDLPSASEQNKINERLERLSVGSTMYTPSGMEEPSESEITYLDLYEITVAPELDDDSREYYAKGRLVRKRWCQVDDDGHWVANTYKDVGGAVPRARRKDGAEGEEDSTEKTLWIVTTPRDSDQEAISTGGYKEGDRVLVTTWSTNLIIVGGGGGGGIELYELTSAATFDYNNSEYWAYAKPVKLVWCTIDGNYHYTGPANAGDAGAVQRYRRNDAAAVEMVYFPASVFRTSAAQQEGIGHVPHYTTQRVYTTLSEGIRVAISPPLDLWRFQLKTELTTAVGYATAYPLVSDGAGGYTAYTDFEFTVYDGYKDRYGWATTEYIQGAVGYAQYYPDTNRFEIVSIQQLAEEIEFTLTTDMATFTASCTVDDFARGRDPTGIANQVSGDPEGEIAVYDVNENFKRALSGAKGTATYDPAANTYWVTECQQQATKLRGTLGATLTLGDGDITLSAMHVMQPFNGQDPVPAITTVPNTFNWEGDNGGDIIIDWDEGREDTPGYIPSQVRCKGS